MNEGSVLNVERGFASKIAEGVKTKACCLGRFVGRTIRTIDHSIEDFKNNDWPFIKGGVSLVRGVLKIAQCLKPELKPELSPVISKLEIISVVSIIFCVRSGIEEVGVFLESVRLRDIEGLALSVYDLVVNVFDGMDSLLQVHHALESFGVVGEIAVLGTISIVCGIALTALGALRCTYKAIWNFYELGKLLTMEKIETDDQIREFLQKKIGVTKEERGKIEDRVRVRLDLEARIQITKANRSNPPGQKKTKNEINAAAKEMVDNQLKGEDYRKRIKEEESIVQERKRNALVRHYGDSRVLTIMKNMQEGLSKEAGQEGKISLKEAELGLRDIKVITATQGITNVASIAFNAMIFSTIVASLATPVSPLIIPIMGFAYAGYKIGRVVVLKKVVPLFFSNYTDLHVKFPVRKVDPNLPHNEKNYVSWEIEIEDSDDGELQNDGSE